MAEKKNKKVNKKNIQEWTPPTKRQQEDSNRRSTEYNRRQLEGGKDPISGLYHQAEGDTPEFGRLASRPEGLHYSDYASYPFKGTPHPARIMKVKDIKSKKPDARKRAKKRGVVTQRYLDQENGGKARGGSVGGPKRKGYANGGSVRAARF